MVRAMKLITAVFCCLTALSSSANNHSCQQPATAIATIQGNQSVSPMVDKIIWVKGIVTADFRGKNQLSGYFIQSQTADNDPVNSQGLFIHENNLQLPIKVGDLVALQGLISEQHDVTQITQVRKTAICSSGHQLPEPVSIKLPLNDLDLESLEGMYVTLAEPYIISDVSQYVKYGELKVSSELLMSPTALHRPGAAVKQQLQSNQNNQLVIDDGRKNKYATPIGKGLLLDAVKLQSLNAQQPIQMGQKLQTTGVLHYAYGQYKLQPTEAVQISGGLSSSQRRPLPTGGNFRIASFNVENFFTTLDNGEAICGPLKNFFCRGADNPNEYHRQLAKLVEVINTTDAAVMGLQELENNADQSIQALVNALNLAANYSKWAYIDTGVLGEDVIKVALIYQPKLLKPHGDYALLDQAADPAFRADKNRVIVTQTFSDQQGRSFNMATVHFKSKSCRDAEGIYLDQNDGQGCYNPTRVAVAQQLAKWLNSDPTGQHAEATFVVGDFNSYQQEDPIFTLKSAGFSNLADSYLPPENWSTSYRGTVGTLDYILANPAALKLTTGLSQWHINSVSIDEFNYNTEPFSDTVTKPADFYHLDPYAASDHDVVIAGIKFK